MMTDNPTPTMAGQPRRAGPPTRPSNPDVESHKRNLTSAGRVSASIGAVGFALAALGTLLPWVTAATFLGSASGQGLEDDRGALSLFLALAGVVALGIGIYRPHLALAIVGAIAGAGILTAAINFSQEVADSSELLVEVGLDSGWLLTMAGTAVAALASAVHGAVMWSD